jgi:hypothetical protein
VDWIGLATDSNRWRTLVNSVLNLRVPWNAGKPSSDLASSGLSSSAQFHRVSYVVKKGARSSADGWGAMLEAERSRNLVPVRSLILFFNFPNPSIFTIGLEITPTLTEMNTRRYFWGVKRCPRVRLTN